MLKRKLKEPFGKAGLTVAICALVLAMVGGAYAAGKLTGSQKKEVEKIAKKYAGKPGVTGANGSNGTNGATGKEGPQGKEGKAGTTGTNGTDGTSVTSTEFSGKEGPCQEGGSEFTSAEPEPTYACNGSPWTAGGTLPSGQTETGAWSIQTTDTAEGEFRFIPISFPIPLKHALETGKAKFVRAGAAAPEECPGSIENPEAHPGFLCIFESSPEGILAAIYKGARPTNLNYQAVLSSTGAEAPGTTGGNIAFSTEEPETAGEEIATGGSWALTAP